MAPKKVVVAKFNRSDLEAKSRPEIIQIAREEREAGREIGGALSRATEALIVSLLKIKIDPVVVDGAGGGDDGAGVDAEAKVQNEDLDLLDAQMEALRLRKQDALRLRKQSADAGSDDGDEDRADRAKLVAPSRLEDEPDEQTYETWRREITAWMSLHAEKGQKALLQSMLTCLAVRHKTIIFAEIGAGELRLSAVLKVLDAEFAQDALLHGREILRKYRKLARGGSTLKVFLREHRHVRTEALLAGVIHSTNPLQDSWDLLEAAALSATQRGNVLDAISREERLRLVMSRRGPGEEVDVMDDPTEYEVMLETLQTMARAFETSSSQQQQQKQHKEAEALVAEAVWQPKGKGKKGQGKGKKGAKKGSSKLCPKYGAGCWFGERCTHKSEDEGKGQEALVANQGKSKGKGKGKTKKELDWKCKCGASVWASKDKCFKCSAPRPA